MSDTRPIEIRDRTPLGEAYLAGRLRQEPLRGDFRPSRKQDVEAVADLAPERRRRLVARAIETLRKGEVATAMLAAGASTRMDVASMPPSARRLLELSGRPQPASKAMVPVVEVGGRVHSFLDLFFRNAARLARETEARFPVVILVSEANAAEIAGGLEAERWYGLDREDVIPFAQTLDRQIVATAEDVEHARKNFASDEDAASGLKISRAFAGHELDVPKPAGHGEFLHQMISSGTLRRLLERGVRHLSLRNVDNTGAVLDETWLAILGMMLETEKRFLVEVSRRPDGPAGKGGALILRPGGALELAEDPAFVGTGVEPRASYYINNAVAILSVDYLFRVYETSADEVIGASPAIAAEIAERGRRKFPPLIDVKPVRLSSGRIAGAFVRETNLWESTGVARGEGVGAVAVPSVKDVEHGFDDLSPDEQRARALSVRFAATKKWEDYEGINAKLVPHVARRILEGPLVER
jgi:hypothetical protein